LAALAEIASDGRMTQRSLASALEVSLGLANALLRELESEGLVRVNAEAGSGAPRYAITRGGRSAMRRLARAFAAEATALLKKSLGRKAPRARRNCEERERRRRRKQRRTGRPSEAKRGR